MLHKRFKNLDSHPSETFRKPSAPPSSKTRDISWRTCELNRKKRKKNNGVKTSYYEKNEKKTDFFIFIETKMSVFKSF